ncbi:hypothetical protein [Paenibacillus sp.]|uniref:hypothetical protein n=1 Tax=Paenibacillus sp. TaxID=58172 RepID=UPI002810A4A1|nr:hypothetical protein [Paenibacillus sp.]
MTVTKKLPFHRFLILVMVSIFILVSPLSLAALQQDHPKASVQDEPSFEVDRAQQAHLGIRQAISQLRLLPTPCFQLLFVIVSLIAVLGVARVLLFLYPTIFLLRKILLLLPIKFTSKYVRLTSDL